MVGSEAGCQIMRYETTSGSEAMWTQLVAERITEQLRAQVQVVSQCLTEGFN